MVSHVFLQSIYLLSREAGGSDRAEENKRHYLALVKRLKKEIGDKQSPSIKFLRQLLPFPKQIEEVIVTEQFGLVTDSKGNKQRGFNCDKKQGLQVPEYYIYITLLDYTNLVCRWLRSRRSVRGTCWRVTRTRPLSPGTGSRPLKQRESR